jgi:hypothetical protein
MSFISTLKKTRDEVRAKTADPWHLRLERVRGKMGDDGIERISTQTAFDILEDRAVMVLANVVRFAVEVEEPLEAENAALRYQLIVLRRKVVASASPTAIACSLSSCIDGFRRC